MARLDRLAIGKEVAQLGATLGREFSYELLQAVALLDPASLQPASDSLTHFQNHLVIGALLLLFY
jgi:predicted ATPase